MPAREPRSMSLQESEPAFARCSACPAREYPSLQLFPFFRDPAIVPVFYRKKPRSHFIPRILGFLDSSNSSGALFRHQNLDPRAVRAAEIDALDRLHEIGRKRLRDIHELLRIAVVEREPGASNLHHNAVP